MFKSQYVYYGAMACLVMAFLLFGLSCTNSVKSDTNDLVRLEPITGIAQNIHLAIYNSENGEYAGSYDMASEGHVTISTGMLTYGPDAQNLFVMAVADYFFTELYYCNVGDNINIDLDSFPSYGNTIAATIIVQESWTDCEDYLPHHCYNNGLFEIPLEDGSSPDFTTDSQGRFAVGNLPDGINTIRLKYENATHLMSVGQNGFVLFYNGVVAFAPNIYLYPEEKTDVHVELEFPSGGNIIKSEPEYGHGWDVTVEPDGMINGQYGYLFYEAGLPPLNNYEYGWVFNRNELEIRLPGLLSDLGFQGREIDDFLDFWIPVLNKSQYYAFFPQKVDQLTTLKIDPAPETVIRQLLYVAPLESRIYIPEPVISDNTERRGFTAVEWGLIGSPDLLD